MEKYKVVLFRSGDLPNDFYESLSSKFLIYAVPVLSFDFESFRSNLLSVDFNKFDCIVFPSQRSVEAVDLASIQLPKIPVCAVGESTSLLIQDKLKLSPWIVGTKGAKSLAEVIIQT